MQFALSPNNAAALQLRGPRLPERRPLMAHRAARLAAKCSACQDGEDSVLAAAGLQRRSLLAGALALSVTAAGAAQAKKEVKADPYEELQKIVSGRNPQQAGLLESFSQTQKTVTETAGKAAQAVTQTVQEPQKKLADAASSAQKAGGAAQTQAAAAATTPSSAAGGSSGALAAGGAAVLLGLAALLGGGKKKDKAAASARSAVGTTKVKTRQVMGTQRVGTQRVGAAPAKAARAVQAGTVRVKQAASGTARQAQKAAPKSGGLFGLRTTRPTAGSVKAGTRAAAAAARRAAPAPIKRAVPAAKRAVAGTQTTRPIRAITEDQETSSTLGAAGVLGVAIAVGAALVLGASPKVEGGGRTPAPKPRVPEPLPVKSVSVAAKPSTPSLPTPPAPSLAAAPFAKTPVTPKAPELKPQETEKPSSGLPLPSPASKPKTPATPDLKLPKASPPAPAPKAASKVPVAQTAAATEPAVSPVVLGGIAVLAIAGVGFAAKQQQQVGDRPASGSAGSASPAGANGTSASAEARQWIENWRQRGSGKSSGAGGAEDESSEAAIKARKAEARKWIDDWRART